MRGVHTTAHRTVTILGNPESPAPAASVRASRGLKSGFPVLADQRYRQTAAARPARTKRQELKEVRWPCPDPPRGATTHKVLL